MGRESERERERDPRHRAITCPCVLPFFRSLTMGSLSQALPDCLHRTCASLSSHSLGAFLFLLLLRVMLFRSGCYSQSRFSTFSAFNFCQEVIRFRNDHRLPS